MSGGLSPYLPVFLFFLFAVGLSVSLVVLSTLLGRPSRRQLPTDLSPYECGLPPADPAHKRFTVKFYLVAMLFIVFDLETAFLYPWAVVYRSLGWFGFFEMVVFLAVLTIGFAYVWKKGALEWKEEAARTHPGASR